MLRKLLASHHRVLFMFPFCALLPSSGTAAIARMGVGRMTSERA